MRAGVHVDVPPFVISRPTAGASAEFLVPVLPDPIRCYVYVKGDCRFRRRAPSRNHKREAHAIMKQHLTLRNLAAVVIAGAIVGFAVFWIVTIPATVPASALPQYTPNADNGKTMFNIGGCSSCHATPNKDPKKVDRLQLGGGLELPCPFGTFVVPNISPDPTDGIGKWSEADFVTALWDGTARTYTRRSRTAPIVTWSFPMCAIFSPI
jgi:hypothetical protein